MRTGGGEDLPPEGLDPMPANLSPCRAVGAVTTMGGSLDGLGQRKPRQPRKRWSTL